MGCAASVRGDLKKIEGITDIQADPKTRVCSFRIPASSDYESQLVEFAKTNQHLAGYSIQ